MPHPNKEAIRRGYQACAQGDMGAISELMADDIVWHSGGDTILTGDYKGREAVLEWFARLAQESGGAFGAEVHDVLANDEHAVALVTTSATRNNKSFEVRAAQIFHVSDGQITESWSFAEDQDALDEPWS